MNDQRLAAVLIAKPILPNDISNKAMSDKRLILWPPDIFYLIQGEPTENQWSELWP